MARALEIFKDQTFNARSRTRQPRILLGARWRVDLGSGAQPAADKKTLIKDDEPMISRCEQLDIARVCASTREESSEVAVSRNRFGV